MATRREFLRHAGVASAALTVPWARVATAQQQLPRRPIPGTDETLPIIGLGNARVFLEGEMETARELMEILRDRGHLPAEYPSGVAAGVLYNLHNARFIDFDVAFSGTTHFNSARRDGTP